MSLTPGFRLGPYEIMAAIGAGGMGELYRARDTKLNLVVRRFDQFEGTAHAASRIGVNARGPFVSPDSQWLGFQTGNPIGTDGQIQKLPLLGGAPVALCDVDDRHCVVR